MGAHHTKDKGDLGAAKAHADLASKGYVVLFPATEHAAFDLVAYKAGEFHRVQVKYRSSRTGAISVQFRSVWADRNGTHMKPSHKAEIDVVCIYCPETDDCYYLCPRQFGHSVTLRIAPSKNSQQRGLLPTANFRTFPVCQACPVKAGREELTVGHFGYAACPGQTARASGRAARCS